MVETKHRCSCYAHVQEKARGGKLRAGLVFFGYYDTDNIFAVFDVNAKKLIKRIDIVGHPSLQQYGLQPGLDILENTITMMASEEL